jgi:hypothetical protein
MPSRQKWKLKETARSARDWCAASSRSTVGQALLGSELHSLTNGHGRSRLKLLKTGVGPDEAMSSLGLCDKALRLRKN